MTSKSPPQPAVSVEPSWGYAQTVGNLIAQLQTMDPISKIGAGYFVTMPNGERRAKVRGLTISRERVDGSSIRAGDETIPYSNVAWAAPEEPLSAAPPADGTPVAWMYERNGKVRIGQERSVDMLPAWNETPLYAAPPADGVPAGFVMVPIEPTDAMLSAWNDPVNVTAYAWSTFGRRYAAMISAAPKAPTAPIGEAGDWHPMSEAPRDGSYILAIVSPNRGRHLEHQAGRVFSIRHEGVTEPSGYDMGWAVYPGFGGASDHDFTHWRPLPAPPAIRSAPSSQRGD